MRTLVAILLVPALCLGLTDDGARLAQTLSWGFEIGNTNVFRWTFPQSVEVSNTTFNVVSELANGNNYHFDLASSNGTVVANCLVGVAASNVDAQKEIFDTLVFCVSMPISSVAASVDVVRDRDGDVNVKRRRGRNAGYDSMEYHRTLGNLYVNVHVNANLTNFGASAFALPVLDSGKR